MEDKTNFIKEELIKWENWFNTGSKQWSFAYHFCVYAATISTLLVAFISQLPNDFVFFGIEKNILNSILAFTAAVLTSIIAKGGLDRKWKSNRLNRGKVKALKLELQSKPDEYLKVVEELKTIIIDHDKVIIGVNLELNDK